VRVLRLVATLLLLGACSAPSPAPTVTPPASTPTPSSTATTPSRPDHVLVVVFENKAYDQIVGSPDAPYLNSILPQAKLLTDAHAVTHPSQPNYLAMFSGSTHGVTDDHCPLRLGNAPNLAGQLLGAGLSFVGYSEDLPSTGFTGCSSENSYAAKHAPWTAFANVPPSLNQPASALPTDYSRLPTVAFVIPNLCHDMHDCSVAAGDAWAATHLDPYLRWTRQNNSLLVITFDEDDNAPDNHILTLVAGANVHSGRYSPRVDHYTVLATIERLYGLPPLGEAAARNPIPL
jgi:acid phosphatase